MKIELIIYDSATSLFQIAFNASYIVITHHMQKNLNSQQRKDQAQRALAEAEQRRKTRAQKELATEKNGRDGPEATRFGDWEKNGLTSDF